MERQEEEDEAESNRGDEELDSEGEPTSNKVELDVQDFEADLQEFEARGAATGTAAGLRKVALIDTDYSSDAETIEFETRQLFRRSFARFVELLDRYGRAGVRSVTFDSIRFDELGSDEADLDRLFREVLPSLPLLDRLCFSFCTLPAPHLGLFMSQLSGEARAAMPPLELVIRHCRGDFRVCVTTIADMIRRNAPVQVLKLSLERRLDEAACRQVFSALQGNSHLRGL
jgi:hypothetical protein